MCQARQGIHMYNVECTQKYQQASDSKIPVQLRADIQWWNIYLDSFNGVSIAWMQQYTEVDYILTTDASKKAIWGYLIGKRYFHYWLLVIWTDSNIAYLEMLAVIVALKAWGSELKGKRFVVGCDNQSVVATVNWGRTKDLFLQVAMREVMYLLAVNQCEMRLKYLTSASNTVSDWLSTWWNPQCRMAFKKFARDKSLCKTSVNLTWLKFVNNW